MSGYTKQWSASIHLDTGVERKPKLSIDEQINHLSEIHGISFELKGVDIAKEFLAQNNYYHKIKAYSQNYSTYEKKTHPDYGKFYDLDFAYLVELSTIDMYLRRIIIKMSLDIEHFLKVQLINDITKNDNENAYDIVEKFLRTINENKRSEISEKLKNYYCERYNHHSLIDIPAWELVEVLSFGDFIAFYELYYGFFPSKDSQVNNLKPVQWLRNAAAHNNCIINDLTVPSKQVFTINKKVNHFVSTINDISPNTREKKLSNKSMHDFVVMLYVYNHVVRSEKVRSHSMQELKSLVDERMILNKDYFVKNALLCSNYNFFKKIVDYFASNIVY